VEYDDLLQVASEALIKGVEAFEPDMGNKFTTYITPTITGIIKNYFRDYSRSVRLPRRVYALTAKLKTATEELYRENGVKPTVKQLAERLGVEEELVLEVLENRMTISLDAKVENEEGEGVLYDMIPDTNNSFEKFEDMESLKAEVEKLDPTEKKVVTLRFIQGKSQAEVGKILGVSQMFVSRAERKIVDKLKSALS
jgi:RNA polymerase sigma-B factor